METQHPKPTPILPTVTPDIKIHNNRTAEQSLKETRQLTQHIVDMIKRIVLIRTMGWIEYLFVQKIK